MKSYVLLMVFAGLLAFGCIQQPQQMYLCDDGKTVVASLNDCPQIDTEYQECLDMPFDSGSYYYESPRDQCFYSLAINRENISLCSKILSTDEYNDYTRAKCGAMLAILNEEPELCEELTTTMDTADCYSEYAYETEDITICNRITRDSEKDECLYQFIGYYMTPPTWDICDEFSDEDYKNNCYYYAAADTMDLSYCDKITVTYSYYYYTTAECYANIAYLEDDPSICDLLEDEDDRDGCYYDYATNYPYHMDVCDYIMDNYTRDSCISWTNDSYYW